MQSSAKWTTQLHGWLSSTYHTLGVATEIMGIKEGEKAVEQIEVVKVIDQAISGSINRITLA